MKRGMLCAFCARIYEWPFDFPDSTYSVCHACYPKWLGRDRIQGSRPWMARLYAFGRFLRRLAAL